MYASGVPLVFVRKLFQGVGSLGPAACMCLLALAAQDAGAASDGAADVGLTAEAASGLFVGTGMLTYADIC